METLEVIVEKLEIMHKQLKRALYHIEVSVHRRSGIEESFMYVSPVRCRTTMYGLMGDCKTTLQDITEAACKLISRLKKGLPELATETTKTSAHILLNVLMHASPNKSFRQEWDKLDEWHLSSFDACIEGANKIMASIPALIVKFMKLGSSSDERLVAYLYDPRIRRRSSVESSPKSSNSNSSSSVRSKERCRSATRPVPSRFTFSARDIRDSELRSGRSYV